MLAGPAPHAVLYVRQDLTQDNLFHSPSQHQSQADKPAVPWILLLALLVDSVTLANFQASSQLPPHLTRADNK